MEGDTQLGFRSNIGISLHMLATAKSRYIFNFLLSRVDAIQSWPVPQSHYCLARSDSNFTTILHCSLKLPDSIE